MIALLSFLNIAVDFRGEVRTRGVKQMGYLVSEPLFRPKLFGLSLG